MQSSFFFALCKPGDIVLPSMKKAIETNNTESLENFKKEFESTVESRELYNEYSADYTKRDSLDAGLITQKEYEEQKPAIDNLITAASEYSFNEALVNARDRAEREAIINEQSFTQGKAAMITLLIKMKTDMKVNEPSKALHYLKDVKQQAFKTQKITSLAERLGALLEKKADVNFEYLDRTPLMSAAMRGQVELVKALLDKKADPNKNIKGCTALSYAIMKKEGERDAITKKKQEIIKLLIPVTNIIKEIEKYLENVNNPDFAKKTQTLIFKDRDKVLGKT